MQYTACELCVGRYITVYSGFSLFILYCYIDADRLLLISART